MKRNKNKKIMNLLASHGFCPRIQEDGSRVAFETSAGASFDVGFVRNGGSCVQVRLRLNSREPARSQEEELKAALDVNAAPDVKILRCDSDLFAVFERPRKEGDLWTLCQRGFGACLNAAMLFQEITKADEARPSPIVDLSAAQICDDVDIEYGVKNADKDGAEDSDKSDRSDGFLETMFRLFMLVSIMSFVEKKSKEEDNSNVFNEDDEDEENGEKDESLPFMLEMFREMIDRMTSKGDDESDSQDTADSDDEPWNWDDDSDDDQDDEPWNRHDDSDDEEPWNWDDDSDDDQDGEPWNRHDDSDDDDPWNSDDDSDDDQGDEPWNRHDDSDDELWNSDDDSDDDGDEDESVDQDDGEKSDDDQSGINSQILRLLRLLAEKKLADKEKKDDDSGGEEFDQTLQALTDYLKREGFDYEIDDDKDVRISYMGFPFWINVDRNSKFYRIITLIPEVPGASLELENAVEEINSHVNPVKVVLMKKNTPFFTFEGFFDSPHSFLNVFNIGLKSLSKAKKDLMRILER
ncbi:MAG: hypothetical protein II150_03400 [Thermoguttaceae bacterium]|nr:hypothetical protein [Thermoguttaceae bacterium]